MSRARKQLLYSGIILALALVTWGISQLKKSQILSPTLLYILVALLLLLLAAGVLVRVQIARQRDEVKGETRSEEELVQEIYRRFCKKPQSRK